MESLELLILQGLLYNKEYYQKVIPSLDYTLFENYGYRNIASIIKKAFTLEKEQLTPELLRVKLDNISKCTEEQRTQIEVAYKNIVDNYNEQPIESLIKQTEDYFRRQLIDRSIRDVLVEFGDKKKLNISTARKIEDAISFSFEESSYYDYEGEFKNRVNEYSIKLKRYPFPLESLNNITNGGMLAKTLSIVMASTGGGKSIFLCNSASHLQQLGFNVLYITCEMSVKEIAKRIDADLLNATQDSITNNLVEGITLQERMSSKNRSNWGKLYIKEYPAGVANAAILRRDIEEIKRRYDIDIDVLVVDYLNLITTSRYSTKNSTSYTLVKAVAEEIRGLGQLFDIPVISATQSNRSALNKELKLDVGLEAVSESLGLPQTADFMFNIISPDDEIWKANHYKLLKILKNRWGDPSNEFVKVQLNTGLARFTDVGDIKDSIMQNKPNELIHNGDDNPGKIGKDKQNDDSGLKKVIVNAEEEAIF